MHFQVLILNYKPPHIQLQYMCLIKNNDHVEPKHIQVDMHDSVSYLN